MTQLWSGRSGRVASGLRTRITRSQFALRVATGLVAAPILVLVIQAGGELLAALVALVLAAAIYELSAGMGLTRGDPVPWLAGAGVVAMTAVALTANIDPAWPLTAAALAVVAAPVLETLWTVRPADTESEFFAAIYRRSSTGIVGLLYVGWLGSYFILLRGLTSGTDWLLLAVFSVMATDTGAFAVGRLLGRHQLAPRISPAKTVEGALGGIAGGFAAVLLIGLLLDPSVAIWKMVLLGLFLPVVSQIGDLAESALKRALQVKDFSQLVPGHGGILDRLDSLLFGVPTVYFFVTWVVL
ncbi:MAG: phosphatidate cytidylyltransferase [Dehalococcoidia bacterium]